MGHSRAEKSVVCLREIIAKFVWKRYLHFLGFPKKCFAKKGKYSIDIDWDCLHFDHKTTAFLQFDNDNDVLDSISFSTSVLSSSRRRKQSESYVSADSDVGAPMLLCSAKFENHRNKRKRFVLSAERETPVTVSVRFKEYFTTGSQSNIQIDLPANIIPGDSSPHSLLVTGDSSPHSLLVTGDSSPHSLLVTDPHKQTFRNSYKWTINTGVIVKGCHKVKASCVVHEQEKAADLEVKTTVSIRNDCFPVVIRRLSDDKIVYTCLVTDLAEIFRSHTSRNMSILERDEENYKSNHIVLTSRGKCKTSGWTDKQIIVSSERVLEACM